MDNYKNRSERSAEQRARDYLEALGQDEWKLSILDELLERVRGIPLGGITGEVTRELDKLRSEQLREQQSAEQRARDYLRVLNGEQLRSLDVFLERKRELSGALNGTGVGEFLKSVEELRSEQLVPA